MNAAVPVRTSRKRTALPHPKKKKEKENNRNDVAKKLQRSKKGPPHFPKNKSQDCGNLPP